MHAQNTLLLSENQLNNENKLNNKKHSILQNETKKSKRKRNLEKKTKLIHETKQKFETVTITMNKIPSLENSPSLHHFVTAASIRNPNFLESEIHYQTEQCRKPKTKKYYVLDYENMEFKL